MRCDLRRFRRWGRLDSLGMHAWLTGPAAVVVLALVAAAWLAVRDVAPTVIWLDVGSPGDDAYITGAFPPERNQIDTYRWTTSSATITVPAPSGANYRLDIAINAVGDQPRRLVLTCPGGETAAQLGVGLTPPSVALTCHSDGEIPVSISVPDIRVAGDGRPLGVAVRDVRVTSIDRNLTALWRLRAGLSLAATIAGAWLAVAALAGRRIASGVALAVAAMAFAISARQPETTLAVVAGPAGVVALAGGYAAWLLSTHRRTAPCMLGVVACVGWLLLRAPNLILLLPARWTPHDSAALQLLPLLAAFTIVAAALVGGRRSILLAAAASFVAAGTSLVPIAARLLLKRWSLVIDGPDWTDTASLAGAALLAATAIVTLLALRAIGSSTLSSRLAMLVVVGLALAVLVPWRNAVMDLNGDEPHYYVTAHSLAFDADLELLDDYLEPAYLANTISPTGNIAVGRSPHPDRYVAVSPTPDNARVLIPDAAMGLTAVPYSANSTPSINPVIVVDGDGDRAALPSLVAARSLVIPISGPCNIDALVLEASEPIPFNADVRLIDANGVELWRRAVQVSDQLVNVQLPLDATMCSADFAGAIVIEADSAIVAQAVDSASGLRILAARPAATGWLLGPLPRDRFATREATARFALHNPGTTTAVTVVRLLTASDTLLRVTTVSVPSGATIAIDLDLAGGVAAAITAPVPIAVGGVGWLPGGSYALAELSPVTRWQFDVPPDSDRDAGIWLALANPTPDPRTIELDDAGAARSLTICAYCAGMLHIPSTGNPRSVSLASAGGTIAVAAVIYEERTGALHFDLGLPLLAALPIWLAGTNAAPVVSVAATLILAIGLFDLLRRIGVNDRHAAWAAAGVALLAPLSPYAVRLYTEPLAACLIVWALVCWDRIRGRPMFAFATLLLASALPLVHGRYTPIAIALAALAIRSGWRHARASRKQVLILAMIVVVAVAIVALSPLTVALRTRAGAGYFSTQWLPHSLFGILFDRGSGLLPFAPWCLLALATPRGFHPLQRAAILLCVVQLSVVALRAGGWQTFGPPARYILPVVPLLVLLAVPGAIRLWRSLSGRVAVTGCLAWSIAATLLLHWVPLAGYVDQGTYFVDVARRDLPPLVLIDAFPKVTPAATSNLLGIALLLIVWMATGSVIWRSRPQPTRQSQRR